MKILSTICWILLNLILLLTAVWSSCGYHQSSSSTSGWNCYVYRTAVQAPLVAFPSNITIGGLISKNHSYFSVNQYGVLVVESGKLSEKLLFWAVGRLESTARAPPLDRPPWAWLSCARSLGKMHSFVVACTLQYSLQMVPRR
jgi:hypothetical protein